MRIFKRLYMRLLGFTKKESSSWSGTGTVTWVRKSNLLSSEDRDRILDSQLIKLPFHSIKQRFTLDEIN